MVVRGLRGKQEPIPEQDRADRGRESEREVQGVKALFPPLVGDTLSPT